MEQTETEVPKGSEAVGRRVPLPRGAKPPITVYVNGIVQEAGKDYEVRDGELAFSRDIIKERVGVGRWAAMYLGLFGTYRKHETIDVEYRLEGDDRTHLASDLAVLPADGRARRRSAASWSCRAIEDGLVERLAKRLGAAAKASAVFGKPVKRGDVTVIPVARARWAFGGGSGVSPEGSGGGGGGAGMVSPIGYIEVRDGGAEFKPIADRRLIGLGAGSARDRRGGGAAPPPVTCRRVGFGGPAVNQTTPEEELAVRGLLALCTTIAALVLVACGGGDDETQSEETQSEQAPSGQTQSGQASTEDDFIARVDEYCVERSQVTVNALEAIGGPRAPADFDEQLEQTETTLPISTLTAENLADFEAPEALQKDWKRYTDLRLQAAAAGKEALEAAKADDQKAYQAALEENARLRTEANAIVEDLGFVACAGKLEADDEAEVTTVIQDVSTEAAPEQCSDLFTENYLKNNFGKAAGDPQDDPLAACEAFQEGLGPDDLAKSVKVKQISGPVPSATAEVVEIGGANDGQSLQWQLVKEGDQWRVSDIASLSG